MTPRDFTYWLQGFVEITEGNERPSAKQWTVIQNHLTLVFDKQTPYVDEPNESIDLFEAAKNMVNNKINATSMAVEELMTQFKPDNGGRSKDDKIC